MHPHLDIDRMLDPADPACERLRWLVAAPAPEKPPLDGRRIALIATHGVEEMELVLPAWWLARRGARVEIVAPRQQPLAASRGLVLPARAAEAILSVSLMENRRWFAVDRRVEDTRVEDFDSFFVPGGAWNPDMLRASKAVHALLRAALDAGRVVASMCHGPLVLVSAGLVRGRRATCYGAVQVDLANAGAVVLDAGAVADGNLVTGRAPRDLPEFLETWVRTLTHHAVKEA